MIYSGSEPLSYNNTYSNGHIWKQALREGERLLAALEPMLFTTRIGRHIASLDEADSTNTVAGAWAADGGPEGAVVTAEYQTRGRGRFDRRWTASKGRNLTFSILLTPPIPAEKLTLVVLGAGVAVAAAVAAFVPTQRITIKWPNDILIAGRKCCGMLMETSTAGRPGERAGSVVLGIGVNVNEDTFPSEYSHSATSVALEAGQPVSPTPLLAAILNNFEAIYDMIPSDGGVEVRRRYLDRLHGIGEIVRVHPVTGGPSVEGVLEGISDTGALRLRTRRGELTFSAGDVSFRSAKKD